MAGIRRVDVRIWAALFVGLLALFVWSSRGEMTRMTLSLRSADPWWTVGLLLLALVIQWLFAVIYVQIFLLTNHRFGVRIIFEALLQRHAISTVVPAGAAPATVLFVRKLRERGMPEGDAVLSLMLFSTLGHTSLALYAVPVILWYVLHHGASTAVMAAAIAFAFIVLALLGLVLYLLRGGELPERVRRHLPNLITRFIADARAHGIGVRDLLPAFVTALAIDGTGIAMLYASLLAIGERPSIAIAVAGYVVGTISLIISPAFQGLGLVEVSMVVVLERLGIARGAAVSATLLFRVGELWLPLVLSLVLQARRQPRLRGAPAHLPALMSAVTGALSIASVMAPDIPVRFTRVRGASLLNPMDLSRTLALAGGFGLLLLSYGLWRRRRVAWILALGLSLVISVAHLIKGHDQAIAVLAGCNAALLLAYQRRFRVRSDVPTLRRGLIGLAASLLLALLYGTIGFWFLDRREFGIEFSLSDSITHTIRLYFSLGNAGLHPRTRYADWFLDSFSAIGMLTMVVAAVSLLRPVVWRRRTLPQERIEARELVERFGDSSLDFFKSAPDKLYFFSSTRDAVAAYGLSTATAVVLGDPVARDDAAFRRLLAEFLDFTDANGWQAAFHQVPPTHLAAYRDAGLDALKIGEESVVDVRSFTLSGNRMKHLRGAVNRLARTGFTTRVYDPPLAPPLLDELREVSNGWLTLPGRRERGFTLGHWDDEYVRACRVMTVEGEDGGVVAFVNLIPSGVKGEATFDLMRHRPDAPSGSMDFLLVRLIQRLQNEGYERLSLGMVPWSDVGTQPSSTFLERAVGFLTPHLGRFFSAAGLRSYKDKFDPLWEPRYLVYGSEAALPQVALAIVRLTEQENKEVDEAFARSIENNPTSDDTTRMALSPG